MKNQLVLSQTIFIPLLLIALIGGCKTIYEVPQVPQPSTEKNIGFPSPIPIVNLGTNIQTLFYENVESSNSDIKYLGRTYGSASIGFTKSNVKITLNRDKRSHAEPIDFDIIFSKINKETKIEGINPASSTTKLIHNSNSKNWNKELPNFEGIRYNQIYEDVTVEYSGNGRILKTRLKTRPNADLEQIRWNYSFLSSVLIDTITGNAKLAIIKGTRKRGLILGRPIVLQKSNNPIAEFTYDEDKAFGLKITGQNPKEPMTIEFELMFSTHFNNYSATRLEDKSIIVVGNTIEQTDNNNQIYNNDIFVIHLDSKGNQVLHSTFIGGEQDDIASNVTISKTGEIIVIGKTNSIRFPNVKSRNNLNNGGYDMCILKLSKDCKNLLQSTTWGGAGNDSGEAAFIKENGNILICGKAGANLPLRNSHPIKFNTVFPVQSESNCKQLYYIAELNNDLNNPIGTQFEAPILPSSKSLTLWQDLRGIPTIGIYTLPIKSSSCTEQSFEMSNYQHVDFSNDPYIDYGLPPYVYPTGWGYHALRWKSLEVGSSSYIYDPSTALNVPTIGITCGDESFLNIAENDAFTPPDPGGTWECHNTNSVEQLALAAAFFMDRWNSPIYTSARRYSDPIYGEGNYSIAIEKVTFCIIDPFNNYNSTNPSHQLPNLCNFSSTSPGSLTVSCTNAGSFYYEPKEFFVREWGLPLVYYLPSVTLDAATASYPNPNAWYWGGEYIGDPPEAEAHLIPLLEDANNQVEDWLVKNTILETRSYHGNLVSKPAILKCYVRLKDIQTN